MFNTISKLCLLSLRLVSYRGSLLWSGVRRRGSGGRRCLPHSCFHSLLLLLLEGMPRAALFAGVSAPRRRCANAATSHALPPQESGNFIPR